MSLKKMLSKVNLSQMIVAAVALIYAFYNYSSEKGMIWITCKHLNQRNQPSWSFC